MTILDLINNEESIEPTTIRYFFPNLSDKEIEKIMVFRVIKHTDTVFDDMDVFENAVNVLNNITPDISKTEGTLPEFIWKALNIMFALREDMELSSEVKTYIKFIFNDNGLLFYPPLSKISNNLLNDVKQIASKGPFPLKEDKLGIQAAKYLYIQEYLKAHASDTTYR